MRQLQTLVLDPQIVCVEKVDVDLTRDISSMIAPASERFFNSNHLLEQINGIAIVFDFQNGVEKFARASLATDWLRFINRRSENGHFVRAKIENRVARRAQIRHSIAQIGTERDADSHSEMPRTFCIE